ncbi:hypothetical protein D3C78_999090 [compost metagenome]
MLVERLAAGRVEAGAGLVEQQELRLVQQRAGDLHPAAVAAVERAHRLAAAFGELLAPQFQLDALGGQRARQAVQGGVVAQVLLDGQVQIEGALLEHHADLRQRAARLLADRAVAEADVAFLQVVEAGEQGDQGRLAGAVGAEQGVEASGHQGEVELDQRLARAVGEADAGHFQADHGVTTTPHG